MKTHLRSLLRVGAACAALALSATALHAADETSEQNTVRSKFSDVTKPGTLKISLPWAEVHVTGTDGNEIVVTSTLEQKGQKETDKDGFRRLDEDVSFEVTEKNNVATIVMSGDNLWAAHGAEFHVQVPRNTNLVLRTEAGGDVAIENIDGDIDVNSMNGEVSLTDIGSSAVINTMNGEVTANFRRAPTKPVSITSMNGEIDLRLPADAKANLRMRTHNGTIRTNFPEGVLQAKTEKVSGKGFTYGYGPSRDQVRELTRQAERMARDAERMARDHAKLARAHAGVATSEDKEDEEKETDETPTPPAAPDVAGTPAPAAAPAPATKVAATPAPAPVHAPMPPTPGWGGGKSIVGTLNGGGVDIQLSTMNGTITLRQMK